VIPIDLQGVKVSGTAFVMKHVPPLKAAGRDRAALSLSCLTGPVANLNACFDEFIVK
jgi:hypothetical protein